jgi:hypothetical protein
LFPRKLKTKWDGPYKIIEIFNNGVFKIENLQSGAQVVVNGQRLKEYFHGEKLEKYEGIHLIDPSLECIK